MKRMFLGLLAMLLATSAVYAGPDSLYNAHIAQAESYYGKKDYKRSAENYSLAFRALGYKGYPNDRYNAACSWAMAGNVDSAFSNLFIIVEKTGFSNYAHFINDTDLDAIRTDKRYDLLVNIIKANKEKKEANLNKPLVKILDTIMMTDQKYRVAMDKIEKEHGRESKEWKENIEQIVYYDSVNVIKVTAILDKYGWLGADEVGSEGNQALFLVIQHADIEVQQKYLPVMREAVKNKKANSSALALLEDRVALRMGGKQIYGSQIERDEEGKFHVSALEDPENVDKRRAEVGLPPLSEYTRNWNFDWDIAAHKKYINNKKPDTKNK